MKKILGTLLLFLAALATATAGIGDWNFYLAYHDATQSLPVGRKVFSLMNGNLLEYDTETTEVRLHSKLTGLSDRYIVRMGYSESRRTLVLLYQSGCIDLLQADGTVVGIPQLRNILAGYSPLDLSVADDEACVVTHEGVALIDIGRAELRNYYKLGIQVEKAAVCHGKLFISTGEELRSCPLDDNPADPERWSTEMRVRILAMAPFADALYISMNSGSIDYPSEWGLWRYAKDESGSYAMTHVTWWPYTQIHTLGKYAVCTYEKTLGLLSADAPARMEFEIDNETGTQHLARAADGTFWGSNGAAGLQAYRLADGKLVPQGGPVGGYGPRRDLCYYMKHVGDRLLLAGGRLDPYGTLHYDPMLATYEERAWRHFQEDGISEATGVAYRDLTCIAQDPADPTHHFASTASGGLYEFRDHRFVRFYGMENSPLLTVAYDGKDPNYVRVDGLNYDAAGNLWMLNNSNDTLIYVLSPGGKWTGVYVEALKKAPTCEKTLFDRKGRLWVTSRRTVSFHAGGLLRLDTKGTLDDKDDVAVYRSSVTNQDGTSYTLGGVYAIAEDRDGAIWVGSATGLFVVSDPDDWGLSDFRVTQVKVPRNDGTNYADYLLNGVAVTAIAVDGANRKWIGTDESGLYLVSADGTETLQHFTADNSPLLSDRIYSISPDPETGEVMIGTDAGLCSYMGDASEPLGSLDKGSIKVYPNPVRPEYHGSVAITGLTENADVKITTTGGQVVAAGTSAGGTFRWDVRDLRGERVAAGVYFVMVATADGKKGAVARVVVI